MKVLEGVRVLDLSRYIAGPYAGMLLADMGAEVIRVEPPGGGEDHQLGPFAPNGESLPYGMILNRNKQAITLNLRSPRGQELLSQLVKRADVVLENFSPSVKKSLGLTYERLKEINPAIIYASVSAFGEDGPYAERVGFDGIFQGMSGIMAFGGFPGSPPTKASIPYVDFSTALSAALGTVLALYHRKESGQGQKVELSLLDTSLAYSGAMALPAEFRLNEFIRPQIGNASFYSFSDTFKARDGWVVIAVIGGPIWRRFARIVGGEELAQDTRFKDDLTRFENRHFLQPIVAQWIAQRTVEEVVRTLGEAKIPAGAVNNAAQMLQDPQVQARNMVIEKEYPGVGAVPIPGVHIRLSKTPGGVERPGPRVGEHNQQVYSGLLGLPPEELRRLEQEGVI